MPILPVMRAAYVDGVPQFTLDINYQQSNGRLNSFDVVNTSGKTVTVRAYWAAPIANLTTPQPDGTHGVIQPFATGTTAGKLTVPAGSLRIITNVEGDLQLDPEPISLGAEVPG